MGGLEKKLSSSQMIILGFAMVILFGSLLLMLPVAIRDGQEVNFVDALFTATSAVCVTGLVVRDTATCWTGFGQAVILLLIQIGGMGVITVAVAIAVISGKKISLKQRNTMQEAISAHQVGGIVRLTSFIIGTTIFLEMLGAVFMAPSFCREFGIGRGIWYALFHSISAFCNAGFDLMGSKSPYSSLTSFAGNWMINFTIMALIVTGGIGFLTWEDIMTNRHRIRKYRVQSKVILSMTVLLIAIPSLYFS